MSETGFEGPTFKDLISANNRRIYTMWAVVWTLNLITLSIAAKYYKHLVSVAGKKHQPLRRQYFHVARMPAIWAITTGLSVMFTRFYYFMNIFEKIYEVLAIIALQRIYVELSGGLGRLLYVLGKLEAANWMNVVPFCCAGACHGQQQFTRKTCRRAEILVKQAFVVVIICYSIQVFLVVMNVQINTGVLTVLGTIASISVVMAMYGANILRSGLDMLPYMAPYQLKKKLAVVQLLVLLGVIQSFVIQLIVKATGVEAAEPYNEDSGVQEVIWANSILALEAPFIMLFAKKTFPPEEIVEFYDKVDAYLPESDRVQVEEGKSREESGGVTNPINGGPSALSKASTFIADGAPDGVDDPAEKKYWTEFALMRLHRNRALGVSPLTFNI